MTTQLNQLTELTTTSDGDLILIREESTGVDKKMKAQNIRAKATTKGDVGLGNVDNTSDANKPISTATQSALDDKADKVVEVIAGTGLDGGGNLSANRTLNLDSTTVASLGKADTATQPGDNVSSLTNDAAYVDAAGAASAAPVQSVNTQTGAVTLTATDVGAYPDTNPSSFIDASGAPVQSVNGETGVVDLEADDIAYDNTASGLAATDVQGAIDEVDGRVAQIEDATAFGQFSWDNTSTTTSVAKPVLQPSTSLIQSIHDRMRGCLLLDDGTVNYYLNPNDWSLKADGTASDLSGDDGMVMVEIPRFYVRNDSSGDNWLPRISATPRVGYEVHPAFVKDGVEVPYRYYSAYDACVFDDSANAYIAGLNLDNATSLVDLSDDKLASVSGVYPMVGLQRAEFRTLAANRGAGWRVGDYTLWSAIGLLLAVETQDLNSQGVYGAGNTAGGYFSSSSDQNDSPHTIAGAGNAIGNGSTDTTSGAGVSAKPGTSFCKYRGIENFWGNCANWTDGVNIFSEGNTAGDKVFLYWNNDASTFADNTATNYSAPIEIANTFNASRFATEFRLDFPWAFLPTEFSTTGSHGTTDRYRTNSGWRVLPVGGFAGSGAVAGAFRFDGDNDSGVRLRNRGARLAY
jgi:hypothetical protein